MNETNKNVYQRIAEVMKEVRYLTKDDNIAFGQTKYKAISEEKVTSTVRESLIKNGLVILPIEQFHKREGTLTTVDVKYRIANIEAINDYIEVMSSGTGADTQDKGVGKAMTYAYKYMLLRTFAIPTGEDPDKISSAELDEKQKLASSAQKKTIREICVKHNVDTERLYLSKGVTENTITQEQAGALLVGLKQKYGDA